MYFIRSCGLCTINTGLAWFTRHVDLYKVWRTLYNINKSCINLPDLWKITGLVNFIWCYRIADFVQYLPALRDLSDMWTFIRSGGLCTILTSLAWFTNLMYFIRSCGLCTILTSLAWFTKHVDLYKVWRTLYNINKSCMIYQTCGKSPGLWTLYGVIGLRTLYNTYQPCVIYQTCGPL